MFFVKPDYHTEKPYRGSCPVQSDSSVNLHNTFKKSIVDFNRNTLLRRKKNGVAGTEQTANQFGNLFY